GGIGMSIVRTGIYEYLDFRIVDYPSPVVRNSFPPIALLNLGGELWIGLGKHHEPSGEPRLELRVTGRAECQRMHLANETCAKHPHSNGRSHLRPRFSAGNRPMFRQHHGTRAPLREILCPARHPQPSDKPAARLEHFCAPGELRL